MMNFIWQMFNVGLDLNKQTFRLFHFSSSIVASHLFFLQLFLFDLDGTLTPWTRKYSKNIRFYFPFLFVVIVFYLLGHFLLARVLHLLEFFGQILFFVAQFGNLLKQVLLVLLEALGLLTLALVALDYLLQDIFTN